MDKSSCHTSDNLGVISRTHSRRKELTPKSYHLTPFHTPTGHMRALHSYTCNKIKNKNTQNCKSESKKVCACNPGSVSRGWRTEVEANPSCTVHPRIDPDLQRPRAAAVAQRPRVFPAMSTTRVQTLGTTWWKERTNSCKLSPGFHKLLWRPHTYIHNK